MTFTPKHSIQAGIINAIIILLTLQVTLGCGGYARNYNEPTIEEGHIRARALLSPEEQRQFDKIFLEAIVQKNNGHLDVAQELLARSLEINPLASEALYELGMLQLGLSPKSDSLLVENGEMMLQKAVQLEPSNHIYALALAERWVRTGKYARSANLYAKLLQKLPRSQEASILVRLYEILGDFPNALKTVELIENLEGEDENTALEKFRIYLEMGKIAQAYGTIEQLSEANPQELRYRVLLGDLYMQNGYKEKALGIYEDVLTTDPGNRLVKMAMLQYYISEGDSLNFNKNMTDVMLDTKIANEQKRALLQAYAAELLRGAKGISKEKLYEHFREALTFPQDDSSLGELCAAFIEASKLPNDSLRMPMKAILRDQPEHLQARMNLLAFATADDAKDTIRLEHIETLCHEGRIHHPDVLIFYYYEGLALYQLDRDAESLEVYEKGIQAIKKVDDDVQTAFELYAAYGDLCHKFGKKEEAFAAYEKALSITPDNAGILNNYAYFLSLENKDLDKALTMSKTAIEAEPKNATYLDTYAWILYCKKQYTQAKIYIDQTLRCLTDEERESAGAASLYDHAGDIYYRCKESTKAQEYWRHALEITDDKELQTKLNKKLKYKKL